MLVRKTRRGWFRPNSQMISSNDYGNKCNELRKTKICRGCSPHMKIWVSPPLWNRARSSGSSLYQRPHFYKRCQDRADSEDDPGMKHKLL
ncbi:hypothetical protein LguiA_012604 [Lonicera macranthoides]